MKVHFLFLTILTYCFSRICYRIEKNQPLSFILENSNSELLASLNYLDNIEENSKEEDKKNNFNFLLTDDSLDVNCIILNNEDSEPNEEILNRYNNKTNYCKYEVELNGGKKLISFPNNFTEEEKIYFLFFIKEESQNPTEINKVFEVKRIPSPKYINGSLDITLEQKDTLIYFISTTKENDYYGFFSKIKLKMPIYRYFPRTLLKYSNEYLEESFWTDGFVGDDIPLYSHYTNGNENTNFYLFIHNYKDEPQNIKIDYFEYDSFMKNKIEYDFDYVQRNKDIVYVSRYSQNNRNFLVNIYNPEKLILDINCNNFKAYFFDYDIEEIEDLDSLTDMKYYKELSTGFFYSKKNYWIFLFIGEEYSLNFIAKNITSNSIEDYFNIFKISMNEEIIFNCSIPGNSIILKSLSSNKGKIQINDIVYNIEEENQILEINHGILKEYKIKALNNDFVFGIKNKIDKNLFIYPNIGKEYNISIFNSEIFIVYELDIINYDFISFDMSNTEYLGNTKFYFKNNFGLLDENEIDKKNTKNIHGYEEQDYGMGFLRYYSFKYYQNKKNLNGNKLLIAFYFKVDKGQFKSTITPTYYKNLNYKENTYTKNIGDDGKFIHILDKQKEDFILYFLGENGISYYCILCWQGFWGIGDSLPLLLEYSLEKKIFTPITYHFKGYVMKIPLNKITANFYVSLLSFEEIGKDIEIWNNTHFLIYMNNIGKIWNVEKENFYLILKNYDKNENYESMIYLFEHYYLPNKTNNISEFEIYNFTYNSPKIRFKYIFSMSKKFNLSEYNREYVFILFEEAYPYKLVYPYKASIYRTQIKNETDEPLTTQIIREEETESIKENKNENENNSNDDYINIKTTIFIIIYLLLF